MKEYKKSFADGDNNNKPDMEKWKEKLTPEQYQVCIRKGTELPFTGKYWDCKEISSDKQHIVSNTCSQGHRSFHCSLQHLHASTGCDKPHAQL